MRVSTFCYSNLNCPNFSQHQVRIPAIHNSASPSCVHLQVSTNDFLYHHSFTKSSDEFTNRTMRCLSAVPRSCSNTFEFSSAFCFLDRAPLSVLLSHLWTLRNDLTQVALLVACLKLVAFLDPLMYTMEADPLPRLYSHACPDLVNSAILD